jgi:RHS repeat-associated protein
VWQATTIDEYSRICAVRIGATAATWGYSATTNMLSQIKGTGVQQYDYDFNGSTGNLNSRTNTLKSKTESFSYDTGNLDRLVSVTGTSAQTIGYDATIKGNIATKTDVGTYTYDATKKYAVKTIANGLNISTTAQSIVYNAFNKVKTITEGTKTADFVYNADRLRISMTLKTSGATTKTRYYFGGSCEREVVGSTTTQTIWIGGDAYTAVAVATKVGTGSWTVYNIFRDHLGTITHLKTGSTITEFSFDAWGRRRDKDDWSYTLTSEPALFADRGFTAHEFLSDFNLYNMNGRLYDPVVGRFLSPDPYIADLSFSQSYNRYAYALNNPLKYNDPNGELPFLAVLGIVWAGNYAIGWLDNVINKKMSAKEAFRNTNFIAGVNFSPADMSKNNNYGFSNNQSDAQKLVGQQSTGMKKITEQISYINENYNSTGNIWNSPSMRFLIPDRITISIPDVNIAIVAGAGQNVEFNWITRGKDARLMPYCTNTFSQRYGIVGDVGAQLSIGWYPGPASQIQKDFLYGNTHNIDGGYIAGGSVFWALDKSGHPIWIGGGIGFGLTIGVSYGKGYTSPGLDDHPRF